MRSNILFVTAAAAAILTGAGLASGQMSPGAGEQQKGSQMFGAQRGQTGTTGQSSGAQQQRGDERNPSAAQQHREKGTTGQSSAPRESGAAGHAPGARQSSQDRQKQGGSADRAPAAQQQRQEQGTTGQAPRTEPQSGQMQRQPAESRSSETTVNLNTEQRTRIRETVLKESNAPRVGSVNFSVSVGTVVPTSVRIVRLPAPIVEIYPAWRDYDYFVVGDEIVVVDPRDHRIVAVLS
jgi:hypothetical protein